VFPEETPSEKHEPAISASRSEKAKPCKKADGVAHKQGERVLSSEQRDAKSRKYRGGLCSRRSEQSKAERQSAKGKRCAADRGGQSDAQSTPF
jgi:hypothetical protein